MQILIVRPFTGYVLADSEDAFISQWVQHDRSGEPLKVWCCHDTRDVVSGSPSGDLLVTHAWLNPRTIRSVVVVAETRPNAGSWSDLQHKRLYADILAAWERHEQGTS